MRQNEGVGDHVHQAEDLTRHAKHVRQCVDGLYGKVLQDQEAIMTQQKANTGESPRDVATFRLVDPQNYLRRVQASIAF